MRPRSCFLRLKTALLQRGSRVKKPRKQAKNGLKKGRKRGRKKSKERANLLAKIAYSVD